MRQVLPLLPGLLLLAACGSPPPAASPAPASPPPPSLGTADASATIPSGASVEASASKDAAYKHDVETICGAPEWLVASHLDQAKLDPSQKARIMAEHVDESLRTEAGRSFFHQVIGNEATPPATRGARLASEAKRVDLAACPFAAWWVSPH